MCYWPRPRSYESHLLVYQGSTPSSEETSLDPAYEMHRGLAEGVERGPNLGSRLIETATGDIEGTVGTHLLDRWGRAAHF